jgi:hypothetical protein
VSLYRMTGMQSSSVKLGLSNVCATALCRAAPRSSPAV